MGVIIVTLIAAFKPSKLMTDSKNFRYSVALLVIVGWPLSILYFLGWLLILPARSLVGREKKRLTPVNAPADR